MIWRPITKDTVFPKDAKFMFWNMHYNYFVDAEEVHQKEWRNGNYSHWSLIEPPINKPNVDLPEDLKEKMKDMYSVAKDNDTKITERILEAVNKRQEIDWEQRRYEIAKDVFAHNYLEVNETIDDIIELADALIEKLKKKKSS